MATGATYIGGKTGSIDPIEIDGGSATLDQDILAALVELGLAVDTSV